MQAVILAGGKGSRLNKLTKEIPKPMVKVGEWPVLHHQINLLKRYNIKDIIILTNYLSEKIENYFKDGKEFGVNISYFKEKEPLGTTGGLKEIEDKLKEDFIVVYGDVMLDMDISSFIDFHKSRSSVCTLSVHPSDHLFDSDLLEMDDKGRITAFYPKPHDEDKYYRNLSNAASLYIMSPKIFKHLEKGKKADFGINIFPELFKKEAIYGYNTAEYMKDMGTLERLKGVEDDYQSGKIKRLNKGNKRKAIFMDRDGTINRYVRDLSDINKFELLPDAVAAIKAINQSDYLAIVTTNQPMIAKGFLSFEDLNEIHKKMETLLGRQRARLDAVYCCPHHIDKGFDKEVKELKIDCECRKPKPGMILKAAKEYNIDLDNSWMIGDSERDIESGIKAGVKTVLVKRDAEYFKECEFDTKKSDNIYSAVNSIIYDNNQNAI